MISSATPRIREAAGSGTSGVSSFNSRTGAVSLTSGDVTTALGFTPSQFGTDSNSTWSNSTGRLSLTASGNGTLDINPASGLFYFGFYTGGGNGMFLELDDGSGARIAMDSGDRLKLDISSKKYQLGDIDNQDNGTVLTVDDGNKFISLIANGIQGLLVDAFTGAYTLGPNGQGNSTNININDSAQTAIVNAANGLILNYLGGGGTQNLSVDNTGKVVAATATQTVYTSRTPIPSAQVLTLNSIPVQLVPAPIAGLAIVPISITIQLTFNTTAYAVNTTLQAYTANVAGGYMSNLLSLQDTSSTIRVMSLSSQNQIATAVPLMLTVPSGNPSLGNSDIVVVVNYMLMTP